MRVTETTKRVLRYIWFSWGGTYGFDIANNARLSTGSVYPILHRLEKEGWIEGIWETRTKNVYSPRPPRKYYELTPLGREKCVMMELNL